MKKRISIISLVFLVSFSLFAADKYLFLFGGGGDPVGKSTIFDQDLKLAAKFIKRSSWKTTLSFDGGHQETEEIIAKKLKDIEAKSDFTEQNYQQHLYELEKKMRSGEIKAGDSLLLMVNSHGAAKTKYEKSHQIAFARSQATNLNTLRGARTVSMDSLRTIMRVAKAKGVKLAIIDLSCHSGNTLALDDDHACIISASGPKHYGYSGSYSFLGFTFAGSFSGRLVDNMRPGKNLEEIFLDARADGSMPDFPMISTAEGQAVQKKLYELLTPYLYFNDSSSTKLDDFYAQQDMNLVHCKLQQQYSELINFLKHMQKIMGKLKKDVDPLDILRGDDDEFGFAEETPDEFGDLIDALEEYRAYQQKYEQSYKAMWKVSKHMEQLLKTYSPEDQKLWAGVDGVSMLNTTFEMIDIYKRISHEMGEDPQHGRFAHMAKKLEHKQQIVEEIKSRLSSQEHKQLADYQEFFANSGKSYAMAKKVGEKSNKVYDLLYKREQAQHKKSNACRDFVL